MKMMKIGTRKKGKKLTQSSIRLLLCGRLSFLLKKKTFDLKIYPYYSFFKFLVKNKKDLYNLFIHKKQWEILYHLKINELFIFLKI